MIDSLYLSLVKQTKLTNKHDIFSVTLLFISVLVASVKQITTAISLCLSICHALYLLAPQKFSMKTQKVHLTLSTLHKQCMLTTAAAELIFGILIEFPYTVVLSIPQYAYF